MSQIIQIKRSQVTATPPELAPGEMAFSELSRTLFIGLIDGSILAIGGDGSFAKLSSPAFSGAPTAPTPTAGDASTRLATTAFVQAALAVASNGDMLKSVYDTNNDGVVDNAAALGGVAAGDYARKTYVDSAISGLVNGAGAALDTLKELSTALGNDPNFATTMTANIATKLAKDANLSDVVDKALARTNLGLASMAVQAANSVNITGGAISGVTINNSTIDAGTF